MTSAFAAKAVARTTSSSESRETGLGSGVGSINSNSAVSSAMISSDQSFLNLHLFDQRAVKFIEEFFRTHHLCNEQRSFINLVTKPERSERRCRTFVSTKLSRNDFENVFVGVNAMRPRLSDRALAQAAKTIQGQADGATRPEQIRFRSSLGSWPFAKPRV